MEISTLLEILTLTTDLANTIGIRSPLLAFWICWFFVI